MPARLFVLISYLLISLPPFFPCLQGKHVEQPWQILSLEILSWLGLWALLKRPRWFHILLLPAFLAIPSEVYLRLYFGQGISTHHLGIMLETSPKEAWEFLGNRAWLLLLILFAMLTWWWHLYRICQRPQFLSWNHYSRWLVLTLLIAGMGNWYYGISIGYAQSAAGKLDASDSAASDAEEEDDGAEDSASASLASTWLAQHHGNLPKLPAWIALPYDQDILIHCWPFGLVLRGMDFWNERRYLGELSEKSQEFSFHAYQQQPLPEQQTIVMVIGESSRYDRWRLNGYTRDTNPLLSQESNLVSFSDVITAVSATRLSVPIIVSRKPAAQSLKAGFAEKSFLTAFKEAGYKTFWLSNQMSFGQFDTPISVFAKEADVTQFLNLGGFTDHSSFDSILLSPMALALRDNTPKKLIVLHTLGNHWNYSQRHPAEFNRWLPSLSGIENPAYTDLNIKPQLNNSYDNSILYTDWFLEQVIQQLKLATPVTALLYVSDHGQTLYDGTCNLAFHGHNTQYEFHIPVFMWYSDGYLTQYPDKIQQLQRHQHSKLSTENIFHSLLDMADIRYPDDKLEWSFLSPQLKPHMRYVDSYGWANYDNANFKGDCREVTDKKTPLNQEK